MKKDRSSAWTFFHPRHQFGHLYSSTSVPNLNPDKNYLFLDQPIISNKLLGECHERLKRKR